MTDKPTIHGFDLRTTEQELVIQAENESGFPITVVVATIHDRENFQLFLDRYVARAVEVYAEAKDILNPNHKEQ